MQVVIKLAMVILLPLAWGLLVEAVSHRVIKRHRSRSGGPPEPVA